MPENQARRCPYCGVAIPSGGHSGCAGLFREVMSPDLATPAAPSDPSRAINQYRLVEVAGRGGMGEVWKAWDATLERWVAIKFLRGASELDAARFLREARLAARLRHPNIAVVHEVGEAPAGRHDLPGRQFLVMDFIDGETLAAARLDLEAALRIFAAVARAIDAAHRAGIIHRDLKPQNILLNREGWPFVTDFGLAKPMAPGGTVSATGAVVGTPAYMPPEQAHGRSADIDERSDVYSLGATFYRVLTGADPFEGPTALDILRRVTEDEPRPPRHRNPGLPVPVDTVLRKCLSKAKSGRYATAGDVADDLDRILSGTGIRGRAPGPLSLALRRARRSALSLGLSAALVGLVAVVVWRERRTPPAPPAPEAMPPALRAPADPRRVAQEAAVAAFVRDLSRPNDAAFAAPDDRDLGEPIPSLLWIRRARPVLLDLQKGRAEPAALLELLGAAAPFDDAFAALWPLVADQVEGAVARDVRAAADLPKEGREPLRRRTEAILKSWDAFVRLLPAELRLRHADIEAFGRDLRRKAAEYPAPLPELDTIDLAACLKDADPEQALDRARKSLVALESRTGVDLESRRRLETMLILATTYQSLLKGASEEDVVKELAPAGAKLRTLGPADPGDVSPRARRILAALLRQ